MALIAKTYLIIDLFNFKQLDHYFTSAFKLKLRVSSTVKQKNQKGPSYYELETEDFTTAIYKNKLIDETFMVIFNFDSFPELNSTIDIEVELYIKNINSKRFPPNSKGYSHIGTNKLRVRNIHEPIHEYVELVFDALVCSVVSMSLHSSLTSFEFYDQHKQNWNSQSKRRIITPNTSTFEGFLKDLTNNASLNYVDEFYSDYNKRLKITAEKLVFFCNKYANLVFDDIANLNSEKRKELSNIRLLIRKMELPYSTAFNNYIHQIKNGQHGGILASKFNFKRNSRIPALKQSEVYPVSTVHNLTSIDPNRFKKHFGPKEIETIEIQPDLKVMKSQIYNETKFSDFITNSKSTYFKNPSNVLKMLVSEIEELGEFTRSAFLILHKIVRISPKVVNKALKNEFHGLLRDKYLDHLLVDSYEVHEHWDMGNNKYENSELIANKMRNLAQYAIEFESTRIENLSIIDNMKLNPVFFEENFFKIKSARHHNIDLQKKKSEKWKMGPRIEGIELNFIKSHSLSEQTNHVVVLVHGYQGSEFDMRLYKNFLVKIIPQTTFILSKANKDSKEISILKMGMKLAEEVKGFMEESNNASRIGRISFIGHSLGGLVIRAALPFLRNYKSKMVTFISLSSPHLGCRINSSFLVHIGMKVIKSFKNSTVLRELDLSDKKDYKECSVYRLSMMEGLNWFQNIIFASSKQDGYVNYESARIQLSDNLHKAGEDGRIYIEMIKNIFKKINIITVTRLSVDIRSKEKSIGWLTGKRPHIEFLESHNVINTILYRYSEMLS